MSIESRRGGDASHSPHQAVRPIDRLSAGSGFVVGTAVESAAPLVGDGVRREQVRDTGHWERFDEDDAIAAGMGIRYLRLGIPFHLVASDPDAYDWSWTDRALAAAVRHGLEPIVELMHGGVPADLDGVADRRLPARFLRYVEAFAARYPRVRYVTPVAEPWVTAMLSASTGEWNERRCEDRWLVAAATNLAECGVLAMQVLSSTRSDVVFLEVDTCERWMPATPSVEEVAAFRNEQRFVTYDLMHGRSPSRPMMEWLLRNHLSEERLGWFAHHGSVAGCVTGHVYNALSERVVVDASHWRRRELPDGYASLAREYHARLGMPFLLATTAHEAAGATDWLAWAWDDALTLREQGLPVRGICWSLTDSVDADTRLGEANGRANTAGLVDLARRRRPVGELFARLATNARQGRLERVGALMGSVAAK